MINWIMSAIAIIIIAGGIIAFFAWLFWKAAHADPEKLAKIEEEEEEYIESIRKYYYL